MWQERIKGTRGVFSRGGEMVWGNRCIWSKVEGEMKDARGELQRGINNVVSSVGRGNGLKWRKQAREGNVVMSSSGSRELEGEVLQKKF